MPKAKTSRAKLYCLRIELAEITPTIWRRIWIEERKSLIELHHTIQAAMGWTDAHLHEFQIGGVTYATPHPEDDLERLIVDERRVTLHKVLHGISQFGYLYDLINSPGTRGTKACASSLNGPERISILSASTATQRTQHCCAWRGTGGARNSLFPNDCE